MKLDRDQHSSKNLTQMDHRPTYKMQSIKLLKNNVRENIDDFGNGDKTPKAESMDFG